jgi:hypothetical protein
MITAHKVEKEDKESKKNALAKHDDRDATCETPERETAFGHKMKTRK